jgi:RNA polymerase sigma-70 factor (ECF subfamily)
MNGRMDPTELVLSANPLSRSIRTAAAGEIEKLYAEHYEAIYRYLVLTGSTPFDADEFSQEAFLRLLEYLQEGNRVARPKSWLFRVLRNIRVDEGRRTARQVTVEADSLDNRLATGIEVPRNPEAELLNKERYRHLEAAIEQLTDRQYKYLLLRAQGLKLREIAAMYGVAPQAVADACARATSKLGALISV